MTGFTTAIALIISAFLAYGIIGILIEGSNNKGSTEADLEQFSGDSIEIISEQDNLPMPMKMIGFPKPTEDATNFNNK